MDDSISVALKSIMEFRGFEIRAASLHLPSQFNGSKRPRHFASASHAKFPQDAVYVVLNGGRFDVQLTRDLRVGQAAFEARGHLRFTPGQIAQVGVASRLVVA